VHTIRNLLAYVRIDANTLKKRQKRAMYEAIMNLHATVKKIVLASWQVACYVISSTPMNQSIISRYHVSCI